MKHLKLVRGFKGKWFIEDHITDFHTRVLLQTAIFFNVVTTLVFGALIALMLFNPEKLADRPSENVKNFLGWSTH